MRAPSRTIPELCEKRPGQPRFSKREKDLNWRFALKCPPRGCGHFLGHYAVSPRSLRYWSGLLQPSERLILREL